MNRVLRWCGTDAAYRRHLLYRQIPCQPCAEAHRRYRRNQDKTARMLRELVVTIAQLFEEEAA